MAGEIDYPALLRAALVEMVRRLLARVADEGLPGEHHFYLSFRTDADGVEMPAGLRRRNPREMTIVLQHQFWGLDATDGGFSVTLRFGGTPTRLTVPWDALTAFADPSVPFGLRLAAEPETADASTPAEPAPDAAPAPQAESPPGDAAPAPNVVAFRRRDDRE